ncbi:MAG: hypothetical protein L3J39_14570 [Verrucomicrobiales bacterium]|nr:hypothetical protein [Verrucomicrobiales bacterium]
MLEEITGYSSELEGGNEHNVYYDPETDRVIKITMPPNFGARGAALTYLQNVESSNELFEDDIRLVGVAQLEEGLAFVISQPFIPGIEATIEQIDEYMRGLGFERKGKGFYINVETGFKIIDADPRNVLIGEDYSVVPIDVQVIRPSEC